MCQLSLLQGPHSSTFVSLQQSYLLDLDTRFCPTWAIDSSETANTRGFSACRQRHPLGNIPIA